MKRTQQNGASFKCSPLQWATRLTLIAGLSLSMGVGHAFKDKACVWIDCRMRLFSFWLDQGEWDCAYDVLRSCDRQAPKQPIIRAAWAAFFLRSGEAETAEERFLELWRQECSEGQFLWGWESQMPWGVLRSLDGLLLSYCVQQRWDQVVHAILKAYRQPWLQKAMGSKWPFTQQKYTGLAIYALCQIDCEENVWAFLNDSGLPHLGLGLGDEGPEGGRGSLKQWATAQIRRAWPEWPALGLSASPRISGGPVHPPPSEGGLKHKGA